MNEKFNGWTNYETWSVALLIDNDEGSYDGWHEAAQECYDATDPDHDDRLHAATIALADQLKQRHEETMPDLGCTLWGQLLTAALGEVNWYELAEHYLGDVDQAGETFEAKGGAA